MTQVTPDEVRKVKDPQTLIYVVKNTDQAGSDNLKSVMQLRHELNVQELMPLPFYYVEKKVFLGTANKINYRNMMCPHRRFNLAYHDIYPPKKYKNLLYHNEYKNIENSRVLKPERSLISMKDMYLNKLLLGTTLLPASIVDYILDGVTS